MKTLRKYGSLRGLDLTSFFLAELDGISAGVFGVVSLLVTADFTKGSGHFNFVNGILITVISLGASLSNVVAGYIVHSFSYRTDFLF